MEIRIKLKFFGAPLSRPEKLFCSNNEVANNTIISESTLSKKHNAINYHCVHEASKSGILRIKKEYTATNIPNPLIKLIPNYHK